MIVILTALIVLTPLTTYADSGYVEIEGRYPINVNGVPILPAVTAMYIQNGTHYISEYRRVVDIQRSILKYGDSLYIQNVGQTNTDINIQVGYKDNVSVILSNFGTHSWYDYNLRKPVTMNIKDVVVPGFTVAPITMGSQSSPILTGSSSFTLVEGGVIQPEEYYVGMRANFNFTPISQLCPTTQQSRYNEYWQSRPGSYVNSSMSYPAGATVLQEAKCSVRTNDSYVVIKKNPYSVSGRIEQSVQSIPDTLTNFTTQMNNKPTQIVSVPKNNPGPVLTKLGLPANLTTDGVYTTSFGTRVQINFYTPPNNIDQLNLS